MGVAASPVASAVPASAAAPQRAVRAFERRAMGSPLRLTVVGSIDAAALVAWGSVCDEFERTEQALSRFRDASDLTAVNRAAGTYGPVEVDPRLRRALAAARRAQRVTGGRFDARVLGDLDRLGYPGAALASGEGGGRPDARVRGSAPEERRDPSGAGWLRLTGRSGGVAIDSPVDLGGIGKGLALRWAWRRAGAWLGDRVGILLEAGGDLVAAGPAPDGGPWRIGIEDPRPGADPSGAPLAVVAVAGGAVCTSSVAVHRWRDGDGRPVHHLIDPATGAPGGQGLLSVTVAGSDPAWAEVWSKTLFLAGAHGIAEAARRRGLSAWWVTEDGDLRMTAGARPATAWTARATA